MQQDQIYVAIYLRKSRSDEGLDALRNHKEVLTRLAKEKGYKFATYEEIGSSVSLEAREALNDLLNDITKYSKVLVMDLDRFARSIAVMEEIKAVFKSNNVTILTPNQEIDLNNEGNELMMDFQSVIAKAEYQQIRKRMQLGKVEGARRGNWVNGVAPLGYDYDRNSKRLTINEDESSIVKEIYRMALQNRSYKQIAITLNLRGFTTKNGNPFDSAGIRNILSNRVYIGEVRFTQASHVRGVEDTEVVCTDAHPQLVDELDYLEVQRLVHIRRTNVGRSSTYIKSMVQGLCYCGLCGYKLGINTSGSGRGTDAYLLEGCGRVDEFGVRCKNRSTLVKPLEDLIVKALKSKRAGLREDIDKLMNADTSSLEKELRGQLKRNTAEIKKLETQTKRLLDLYLEAELDKESYTAKKKEKEAIVKRLREDSRATEIKISNLDKGTQMVRLGQIYTTLDNFEELDVVEASSFLQTLIKKIVVTIEPDEKSIYRSAKKEADVVVHWL